MATHPPNRSRRVRRLVAVAAITLLAASCGDDDDDDADGSANTEASSASTSPPPGATPGASSATTDAGASAVTGTGAGGAIDPMEATVEVTGDALAPLSRSGNPDPAVGVVPPTLAGTTYDGEPIEIVPGADGATMLVFLAHWCPHCNAEIPVLLEWRDAGSIPDELSIIGVSTGVRDDAPNFPPDEWLEENGWDWPTLADSPATDTSSGAAGDAYGLAEYPFFTVIGADGTVKLRAAGEKTLEELDALVTEALER